MRHLLVTLALCAMASHASADCPPEHTITAFGHTYESGGLIKYFQDKKDCDQPKQPEWIAQINSAPAPKGATAAPALEYCRKVVASKDSQFENQRRDCVYWYGHSIEPQ
jgi:hypothetical protein